MKEWEIFVPYLPRVKSTKRRWDDIPSCKSRPPLLALPLSDVNNRPMEWRRSDYFHPEMIPEPDYTDPEDEDEESEDKSEEEEEEQKTSDSAKTTDSSGDESQTSRTTASSGSVSGSSSSSRASGSGTSQTSAASTSHLSDDGFALPRKPSNPYLQSTERQKLHKELKFNQKYGKNVVGKKSELQMAMEKYKENKLRRDTVQQQTSLEKLLDQRAKKLEMQENQDIDSDPPEWMDRLKEQREIWVDPKEDEFYRVHAKVVTHGGYSRNPDNSSDKSKPTPDNRHDSTP